MGWFDNEKQKERAEVAPRPEARRQKEGPAPEPRPAAPPGSTLGERVHVDGTIVSREDLTVVGRVEGTIRAEQTLRIAEEARVDAVIHGRRILVQGTVNGDVHGSEAVVLGPTASVTGNIRTPALEIHDGAFFKGQVDMKSARKAVAERAEKREARPTGPDEARTAAEADEEAADSSGDAADGGSEADPEEGTGGDRNTESAPGTTTPAVARPTEAATSS